MTGEGKGGRRGEIGGYLEGKRNKKKKGRRESYRGQIEWLSLGCLTFQMATC